MQVTFGVNYYRRPSASQLRAKLLQHCLYTERLSTGTPPHNRRIDYFVGEFITHSVTDVSSSDMR